MRSERASGRRSRQVVHRTPRQPVSPEKAPAPVRTKCAESRSASPYPVGAATAPGPTRLGLRAGRGWGRLSLAEGVGRN